MKKKGLLKSSQRKSVDSKSHQIQSSSQAGLRADGAGESALPAEESPSAGSANSENFTSKQHGFHHGSGRGSLTLLAVVLIL